MLQLFRLIELQKDRKTIEDQEQKNRVFSLLFETVDMDEKFHVLSIGAIVNPLLTSC